MKKQFIAYSLSNALNRATQFLFLPLATQVLSLSDFGLYSLTLAVSQLCFPFFSLNGGAAITREGAGDISLGRRLLSRFSLINIGLLLMTFALMSLIPNCPVWLYFGLILGGLESLHQLLFAFLRISDSVVSFFTVSLLKALLAGASFLIFKDATSPLESILLFQVLVYAALALALFPLARITPFLSVSVKPFLAYCLFLLPAGIGQWLISGSDRFVIKALLDDRAVGDYSIAYNIALILMIVNSGLALTLPQIMFRDFKSWLSTSFRLKFSVKVVSLVLLTYCCIWIGAKIDQKFIGMIEGLSDHHFPLITWVAAGILNLSFFYLPSNVIFYHKKTYVLTGITLSAAALNIILTFWATERFGIIGAAQATFVSYLFFSGVTIFYAHRIERKMAFNFKETILWGVGMSFIFGFSQIVALLG